MGPGLDGGQWGRQPGPGTRQITPVKNDAAAARNADQLRSLLRPVRQTDRSTEATPGVDALGAHLANLQEGYCGRHLPETKFFS